jgi:hypothetical protein
MKLHRRPVPEFSEIVTLTSEYLPQEDKKSHCTLKCSTSKKRSEAVGRSGGFNVASIGTKMASERFSDLSQHSRLPSCHVGAHFSPPEGFVYQCLVCIVKNFKKISMDERHF